MENIRQTNEARIEPPIQAPNLLSIDDGAALTRNLMVLNEFTNVCNKKSIAENNLEVSKEKKRKQQCNVKLYKTYRRAFMSQIVVKPFSKPHQERIATSYYQATI